MDVSAALVPEGADPYEHHNQSEDEQLEGGDIERQESGPKIHEGMPEVRKQLKYLMPALGIGVCFMLLSWTPQAKICQGLSFGSGPDNHCL